MENTIEMMEQTNPEVEVDEDILEFEDEEEAVEETATEETTEEQTETEEQAIPAEEMFPGEFNVLGEMKQVTMADAPQFIQKGLAYDQMKEKYKARLAEAHNDPRLAFVEELANEAGVTASEYIANARMRKEYAQLLETYPSLDEVPPSVMKMFTENAEINRQKIEARKKAETEQKQFAEFNEFMENHPELAEIPQEVIAMKVNDNMTLKGAFAVYENKTLKEKIANLERDLKIEKQNNKNKATTLPSAVSGANKDKEDEMEWLFN